MHYQQAYSTTGSLFIQGFVSTKIQRIVWKANRVSRGDHTIEKEHANCQGWNDLSVGASALAEAVESSL